MKQTTSVQASGRLLSVCFDHIRNYQMYQRFTMSIGIKSAAVGSLSVLMMNSKPIMGNLAVFPCLHWEYWRVFFFAFPFSSFCFFSYGSKRWMRFTLSSALRKPSVSCNAALSKIKHGVRTYDNVRYFFIKYNFLQIELESHKKLDSLTYLIPKLVLPSAFACGGSLNNDLLCKNDWNQCKAENLETAEAKKKKTHGILLNLTF